MPELKAIGRHNRLAMQVANQGRTTEALLQLASALHLARKKSKPLLEAVTKNNMALVYQMAGRNDSALTCFQAALDLAHEKVAATHVLVKVIKTNRERLLEQATRNAA